VAAGKVPGDIQLFLPWNLSQAKKRELGGRVRQRILALV
jgi:hypothetical protein